MMKLLVTCGPGVESRADADILVVDWDTKQIIDHINLKQIMFPVSPKGFAGAALNGDHIVVTSEVELFKFNLNPITLICRTSPPSLNDAHYILPIKGKHYVCNSGMDTIEVFNDGFEHLETIFLLEKFNLAFDKTIELLKEDLRRFIDRMTGGYKHYSHLKYKARMKAIRKLMNQRSFYHSQPDKRLYEYRPHILHPNCLVEYDNEIWVTMFRPGVVFSLDSGRVLASGLNRPHDGEIDDGAVVVTECQTNKIVVTPIVNEGDALPIPRIIDATLKLSEGFLRGLAVTGDSYYCGLTVRRIPGAWKTARVLQIDKISGDRIDEWEIPVEYGQQVYSVLNVSEYYQ